MSRVLKLAAATAFAVLALTSNAAALPGDIDTGFAAGGLFAFIYPTTSQQTYGQIGVQSTGKIVLATAVTYGASKSMVVKRLNADGTIDSTFGTGGATLIDFDSSTIYADFPRSLRVLPGDGILISGFVGTGSISYAGVARLSANGIPDAGFAGGQTVIGPNDFFGVDAYQDIVGRTLVLSSDDAKFQVSRLLSNGSADNSFATPSNWNRQYDPNAKNFARGVLIADQGDGRTLIGGTAKSPAGNYAMTVMRLNGSVPDATYDGDGLAQGPDGIFAAAGAMQPDGKVVLAGYQSSGLIINVKLERFTTDGALDASFGSGGVATLVRSTKDYVKSVDVDSAGRIVVLALVFVGTDAHVELLRFLSDGSLDASFGDGGVRTLPFPAGSADADRVKVDGNGNYLASAYDSAPSSSASTYLTRVFGGSLPLPLPPPAVAFTLKIGSPKGSSVKSKKLKSFSGTAASNRPLAKVEVALQRTDKSLLKKKKRCLWLKNAKGALKRVKAKSKKCGSPVWLTATGTAKWSYRLKKALKPGKYVLSVRAKTTTGDVSSATTRRFKLKR